MLDISSATLCKASDENPIISKLTIHAFMNSPKGVRTEIQSKYKELSNEFMPAFFKDIDFSRFRTGVSPQKAQEITMLFLAGLQEKYTREYQDRDQEWLNNVDKIMEEFREYIELLKYGIYAQPQSSLN